MPFSPPLTTKLDLHLSSLLPDCYSFLLPLLPHSHSRLDFFFGFPYSFCFFFIFYPTYIDNRDNCFYCPTWASIFVFILPLLSFISSLIRWWSLSTPDSDLSDSKELYFSRRLRLLSSDVVAVGCFACFVHAVQIDSSRLQVYKYLITFFLSGAD